MSSTLAFVVPSITELVIFGFAAAIPLLFTVLVIQYVNKRTAKESSDK